MAVVVVVVVSFMQVDVDVMPQYIGEMGRTAAAGDYISMVTFVWRISGSERSRQLRGFHPCCLMAFLLVCFRGNDLAYTILISGKISRFCTSESNPMQI